MMADKLSLAALIAANAFEKARSKRRNIPYIPFSPTKSQLEDWKEVVLAVRAADHAQPKPASPWRDIESAPMDGTKIVVGIYFHGGKYPEEARWDFWVDSWRKYASGYGEGFGKPARPTVWMPLPEPPR